MNKILKYTLLSVVAGAMMAGCSDWVKPERVITQHPDEQSPILRDDAYYQSLREYKKTKHKLAFGWYGSWTANGASYQTRLVSAPDSMDIISIWSQWHSLTPEQIEDKRFVQEVKGTKVTFTTFIDNLPKEFRAEEVPTEEEIANFARAWGRDSINKYNYDGMDIDYEPGFGASGPLVGHDNKLFTTLIKELGKYLGPKSGTGKLLIIDGVPYAVDPSVSEYFDYGIVQAYASSGYTDLQDRFNNAFNKGWKPEQYIFAENFESYWKTGGVNHTCRDGQRVNSLLGMARFNPEQGFCAGFGAYHMEYEYAQSSMPYMYMRKAIQDVNPAGSALMVSLDNSGVSRYSLLVEDDGSISGSVDFTLKVNFARPVPADVEFQILPDNSMVEKFNSENSTEYRAIEESRISVKPVHAAKGEFASTGGELTLDTKGLEEGHYLLPLTVNLPEESIYTSKEPLVKYVVISLESVNIRPDATEVTGTKIDPVSSWTINCYQGDALSGATGVWNCDSDEQKAAMFDGKLDEKSWYANSAGFSWGNGGNFVVSLDKPYEINGFRWHTYYQDCNPQILDIQYGKDGKNWTSLLNGTAFVPKMTDSWKIFQMAKPVTATYIRVIVGPLSQGGFTSMNEIELYAPAK